MTMTQEASKIKRRPVRVRLVESSPGRYAIGHWILGAPGLLFSAWLWNDLFAYISPLPRAADWVVATLLYIFLVVLPLGYTAHRIVTSWPRLFQFAGWTVEALEPVSEAEQYMVRHVVEERVRATCDWQRTIARVGQGWVYLEVAAIFVGALLMIPLFLSATEFGFGQ